MMKLYLIKRKEYIMNIDALKEPILKIYNNYRVSQNYKRYASRTEIKKLTNQQKKEAEDIIIRNLELR